MEFPPSPKSHHPQVELDGVLVDEQMAPLLARLWERGWQTGHSCQGDLDGSPRSCYVSFVRLDDAVAFLRALQVIGHDDFYVHAGRFELRLGDPSRSGCEAAVYWDRNAHLTEPGVDLLEKVIEVFEPPSLADDATPEERYRALHPWVTDEWMRWWTPLDHSGCGVYLDFSEDLQARQDLPDWFTCRDMHCPDCGKKTGSQGHRQCPERDAKRTTSEVNLSS